MKRKKLENGDWYTSDDGGKTWSFYKKASKSEVQKYEYEQAEKEAGYKESEAYGIKGLERLNRYRESVGKSKLKEGATPAETEKIVREGIEDLQEYSGKEYSNLVYDYFTERNPQPNIKLAEKWKKAYNNYNAEPTMDDIRKAIADKKLSYDDIIDAYKDKKWWFRAVVPRVVKLKKDEYDKKMKELEKEKAIEQGGKKYYRGDQGRHDYVRYITEDETVKPNEVETKPDGTPVTTTTPGGKTKKDETKVTTREEIKRYPVGTKTVETYAPWWLQDIIGVAGAAGDLARIKRYPPWQAKPDVHLPEGTFYDPTRELAANAEQANIQTQGLAAFTGPQALSARSSAIQGQALKNAADVMGRYNNLNVGLANELNQQRTQILNAAEQNQANLDTQLWDKYTIMNQQFDNSKAQARQELRKHYINAITNRAKTQALNTLYPNYQVDPISGGYVYATDLNYDPNPDYSTDDTAEKMWAKAQKIDAEHATDIFKVLMNQNGSSRKQSYPYQGYDEL